MKAAQKKSSEDKDACSQSASCHQMLDQTTSNAGSIQDNRSNLSQLRTLQTAMNSDNRNIIQTKTRVHHTTGNFSYFDHDDQSRKNQTVGSEMRAFLDPNEAIKGSATGGPQKKFIQNLRRTFPNDNMIRGHLLNHDLGGFGVEPNLFPITSYANGVHLRTVENGAKRALSTANQGEGVFYRVNVHSDFTDDGDAPVSRFDCTVNKLNDVENHAQDSIGDEILKVNVTSSPKKSGGKRPGLQRGSAQTPDGHAVDNIPRSTVPGAWKHGSRSGKKNFQTLVDEGKISTTAGSQDEEVEYNEDTALLYLDEHSDELLDIFDRLCALTNKDDIADLEGADFDLMTGEEDAIVSAYGEVVNWCDRNGVNYDD